MDVFCLVKSCSKNKKYQVEKAEMKKYYFFIGLVGIAFIISAFYQLKILTERHSSFLPPAGEHLEPQKTHFKVAFFSDSSLKENPMEEIIGKISKSGNEFTIFCGDIAEQRSFNGFAHLNYEMSEKLTIPLYAIPGNHDTDVDGGGGLKLFHQFFGQDRYYFSYGDTIFIGLNTSHFNFSEENKKWLASLLKKERQHYKRCVIYCHIPPVDLRPGKKYCLPEEDADRFYDAIKDHSVSMIISGHIHQYLYGKFHDVDLLILPPSGQRPRTKEKTPYGYVQLFFNDNGTITHQAILDTYTQGREYFEYYFSIYNSLILWLGIIFIIFSGIMIYRQFNFFHRNKTN